MSNVKRCAPVLPSVPTRPSSRPSTIIAIALTTEPCASTTAATRPSTISAKYSGAPNDCPTMRERRRQRRDHDRRDGAGEERGERGDRQCGAGAPLTRHLVAVDAGDDRRRLARQVDEDRRRRAAVLRAVEDAGQHDQPRHRLEVERQRQQHRDRRDRADARQHADQRADQAAQQREPEVLQRQRHAETESRDCAIRTPSAHSSGSTLHGHAEPEHEHEPSSPAPSASAASTVSHHFRPRIGEAGDQHEQDDRRRQGRAARSSARRRRGSRPRTPIGRMKAGQAGALHCVVRIASPRAPLPQALHQHDRAEPHQQPAQQPAA